MWSPKHTYLWSYLELWGTFPLASQLFLLLFPHFLSLILSKHVNILANPSGPCQLRNRKKYVLLLSLGLADCYDNSLYYIMLGTHMYHPWVWHLLCLPSIASACEDSKIMVLTEDAKFQLPTCSLLWDPHTFLTQSDSSVVGGSNIVVRSLTLNLENITPCLAGLFPTTACSRSLRNSCSGLPVLPGGASVLHFCQSTAPFQLNGNLSSFRKLLIRTNPGIALLSPQWRKLLLPHPSNTSGFLLLQWM